MAKPTMNVSLTPELERFVHSLVESGTYSNQSEVVRAGLRLLEGLAKENDARIQALRSDLQIGIDQMLRGEGKSMTRDELLESARAAYAARQKKTA